jgi:sugar/nucleoside kinase (ribokinase family)
MDIFGDAVEQDLRASGVRTEALRRSSIHGTSKTVVLPVIGEDRRYIHTIGANADFTVDDIVFPLAMQAQVFALGGYFVLPGLDPVQFVDLLTRVRNSGVRTVLDIVVPASTNHPTLDDLRPILPLIDVFVPNAGEAAMLTGETDPGRQAELFLRGGCNIAIITRGKDGALLMSAHETLEAPAFPVEVVDVSGAGDAFVAGIIVGLLEAWSLADTLCFASMIGASACTQLGCTGGVFTRAEAEAYMQTHPLAITSYKTS